MLNRIQKAGIHNMVLAFLAALFAVLTLVAAYDLLKEGIVLISLMANQSLGHSAIFDATLISSNIGNICRVAVYGLLAVALYKKHKRAVLFAYCAIVVSVLQFGLMLVLSSLADRAFFVGTITSNLQLILVYAATAMAPFLCLVFYLAWLKKRNVLT